MNNTTTTIIKDLEQLIKTAYYTGHDQGFHESDAFEVFLPGWKKRLANKLGEVERAAYEKGISEIASLKKENTTGDSYVSTHNIALNLAIDKLSQLKKENSK